MVDSIFHDPGVKSTLTSWQKETEVSLPRAEEVLVWRVFLNEFNSEPRKRWLSEDERERASRFHFGRDRHRFIATRLVLRHMLGTLAQINPGEIRFSYTPLGKPELSLEQNKKGLCFNVSHSHDLALLAVSIDLTLGVDLEKMTEDFEWSSIMTNLFSHEEIESILASPPEIQRKKFYMGWTRKEAYLKAVGHGLVGWIDSFEVMAGQKNAAESKPSAESAWTLVDLYPAPGYAAALAYQGSGASVRLFDWTESLMT